MSSSRLLQAAGAGSQDASALGLLSLPDGMVIRILGSLTMPERWVLCSTMP